METLGQGLASFALALPAVPSMGIARLSWEDILTDERDPALVSDTAETEEAQLDLPDKDGSGVVDHSSDPIAHRESRCRWCRRATGLCGQLPVAWRMLVLRLTLAYWSAGNWQEEDPEPVRLIRDLVAALDVTIDNAELQHRVSSLVAVGLTMVRERVDHDSRNEASLVYRHLVGRHGHLLVDATTEFIDTFVEFQTSRHGYPLSSEAVDGAVTRIVEDDLDLPVLVARRNGWALLRPGSCLLHVKGDFGNPQLIALKLVGVAEDHPFIGVWASSDDQAWAFVAWRRPSSQSRPGHASRSGSTRSSPARSDRQHSLPRGSRRLRLRMCRHGRRDLPFEEALQVLDELGLDDPAPPTMLVRPKETETLRPHG